MTDKKFFVTEVEVISPETINSCDESEIKGEIYPAVTCKGHAVSFECRNDYVAMELCEYMNKQEEKLFIEETDCKNAKESRDYWREQAEKLTKKNDDLLKQIEMLENLCADNGLI